MAGSPDMATLVASRPHYYGAILADQAWLWKSWGKWRGERKGNAPVGGRDVANHYELSETEDICRLPVGELAATDSVLFLWATWPMLDHAMAVIQALTCGKRLPEPRYAHVPGFKTESMPPTPAKKTNPWENPARIRNPRAQWEFSARTLLLRHKSTGQTFQAGEYTYDGEGALKGFALRNTQTPWVRLEDVDLMD